MDVGDSIPQLRFLNDSGQPVDLSAPLDSWVLLYWYPKADTPGCTAQARGLADQIQAFEDLGCTVFGASLDTVEEISAFRSKYELPFSLLVDPALSAGAAMGVLGEDNTQAHAERVSFLFSPDGVLRQRYEVSDPTMHAEDVLDDLEELIAAESAP